MGILSSIFGDAVEIDTLELEKDFTPILLDGEEIEAAFKIVKDKWVFTNKRLIMLNFQKATGKQKEYRSIPYKAITQFSVETGASFDTDSEIKIWVSGQTHPVSRELQKGIDVVGLQQQLAFHTCK